MGFDITNRLFFEVTDKKLKAEIRKLRRGQEAWRKKIADSSWIDPLFVTAYTQNPWGPESKRLVGFAVKDADNVPEGWRVLKRDRGGEDGMSMATPKPGKKGRAAREIMQEHQPPVLSNDVFKSLGLESFSFFGRYMLSTYFVVHGNRVLAVAGVDSAEKVNGNLCKRINASEFVAIAEKKGWLDAA